MGEERGGEGGGGGTRTSIYSGEYSFQTPTSAKIPCIVHTLYSPLRPSSLYICLKNLRQL